MTRRLLLAALCLACGCSPFGPRTPLSERGPKPKPITPPAPQAIDKALERGIAFLVQTQNKNGSWGSARRTKALNIYAPVPGAHHAFRAAVTGLCISALVEAGGDGEPVRQAIARGEAWMMANLPRLRRATPRAVYNVWGHAYAIQALVRLHARASSEGQREQLRELIRDQIGFLERYESVHGGWGYYDFRHRTQKPGSSPTSFLNATCRRSTIRDP